MLNYPLNIKKLTGRFIERKNRFLVTAEINGKTAQCYLPNPGRLWELLIPNETELILVENHDSQKLPFTVLACRKRNDLVLLHTHLTNKVIKFLINQKQLPFYKGFQIVSEEIKVKKSRLDLLLQGGNGKELYLEVKTCTLFGEKIAMFPDAVTERGRRHLFELKELAQGEVKASVLFVVMSPKVEFFLPAYHIDYEFSRALMNVKDVVDIRAIALEWDNTLSYVKTVKEIQIPFSFIEKALHDRGVYILIAHLEKPESINIGKLREIHFPSGYYVYVGKAKKNLFERIARHRRKLKKMHWHIDYFLSKAKLIRDLPIITDKEIECDVAHSLCKISDEIIPQFGSSDCSCHGHLFYFRENPVYKREFIEIVNYFRLDFIEI